MITGIIFSKDRPAQLQACIDSIHKNASGVFDLNVLYAASNEFFQRGYDLLKNKGLVSKFIEQDDFKKNFEWILDRHEDTSPLFCCFTDDSIIYKGINFSEKDLDELFFIPSMMCLSLRLGRNTVVQNPYKDTRSVLPIRTMLVRSRFLIWEWFTVPSYSNFGYPFSVDGHIYRKNDMLKIFESYGYDTPNSLEGRFPVGTKLPPLMSSLTHSVLVNTPINIVGSSENESGKEFGISLEDLNDKYLQGKSINMEKIDFSNIIGCHQELEMVIE